MSVRGGFRLRGVVCCLSEPGGGTERFRGPRLLGVVRRFQPRGVAHLPWFSVVLIVLGCGSEELCAVSEPPVVAQMRHGGRPAAEFYTEEVEETPTAGVDTGVFTPGSCSSSHYVGFLPSAGYRRAHIPNGS